MQVCAGLMAMSITLDAQKHGLRQPEGTFKEMEKMVDNLERVKFPGYCGGHHIHYCSLKVTI